MSETDDAPRLDNEAGLLKAKATSQARSPATRRWSVVVVVLQIIALVSLLRLDNRDWYSWSTVLFALYLLAPTSVALDTIHHRSRSRLYRSVAIASSGLTGLLFALSIMPAATALDRERSWFTLAKFTVISIFAATYSINVVLLLKVTSSASSSKSNAQGSRETAA